MSRSHELADALGSFFEVFRTAGRVLARSWPVLLALTLAGATARALAIWGATLVSRWSGLAALFVVPLAPIATLMSFVLMLRLVGQSLPAFSDEMAQLSGAARTRRDLTVATQVLIPFLTVYATQGLLSEDTHQYVHDAVADEVARYDITGANWGRVDYAQTWQLVLGLVIVVLLARKVLSFLKLPERSVGWSAVGGYLEALWLVAFVSYFTQQLDQVTGWFLSRRAVVDVTHWVTTALAGLGPVGHWLLGTGQWFIDTVSALGAWVVVPVAWLGIGAVIFGTELDGKVRESPTHEQVTARLQRVPSPVRRVVAQAAEPLTTPVRDAVDALKRVAVAGVLPMLLFCVVFVLADQLRVLVVWLMRQLLGGQDVYARAALLPYYQLAARTVFSVLIVVLVASAVNVVVLAQRRRDAADAAEEAAEASADGATAAGATMAG